MSTQIRQQLAERIGRHKFDMWFEHTARLSIRGKHLEIATDSTFVKDWIDSHFASDLAGVARETLGDAASIQVRVAPDLFAQTEPESPRTRTRTPDRRTTDDKDRHLAVTKRRNKPAPARTQVRRKLDDFIVGTCNELAFAASRRLAEHPEGGLASPLFLHGECGVGKTHLLHGVCQRFAEAGGKSSRIRYITGEQFTNEYIAAVRNNTIDEFRRRMRKLDVLAIDDVHFLSNKVATQSEFLHTIDAIDLAGARVVLASDEHPRHIKRFSRALVSRFLSGMVVQVDRPDRETRTELIRRLATSRGMTMIDSAVEAFADRCVGSVRELEGAITKLDALRQFSESAASEAVGMLLVEQLFKDAGWQPAAPVRIGTVIDVVCQRLAVDRIDLMGSGRHRRVVLARAMVAYLGRELTTLSYPEIAQALGRSYHSTVHTADQRLRAQMKASETIDLGGAGQVNIKELVDQLRHEVVRATARA